MALSVDEGLCDLQKQEKKNTAQKAENILAEKNWNN